MTSASDSHEVVSGVGAENADQEEKPLISVVIPCLNRQADLTLAIESALAQTLAPWEIVVVDDGSTEPLIVPSHPKVRLLRQDNAGPAAARNKGASVASGTWIAFLDSDDTWVSTKLEKQWHLLRTHSAGLCFGNMDMSTWGITLDYCDWTQDGSQEGLAPNALTKVIAGRYIPTSTILVRKKLFDLAGGFDCKLEFYEDFDLTLRLARLTSVVFTNACLGAYVRRGDSFGKRAKLPIGIAAEVEVLRKAAHDGSYPAEIRALANKRVGQTLFELAYAHRKRLELLASVKASLRSMAHAGGPLRANTRNLFGCIVDALLVPLSGLRREVE